MQTDGDHPLRFLLFIELINGCNQLVQCILNIGILHLGTGCCRIAAASQRLQDHLHIGRADTAGGDDDPVIVRIQHEGGTDTGNIQQFVRCLGRHSIKSAISL